MKCCVPKCRNRLPKRQDVVTDPKDVGNRNCWTRYIKWVCPECEYQPRRKPNRKHAR